MRKVFWCGCAVVVAAAACVYVTARYVDGHPESTTARCAGVAWRVAVEWNPVVGVGRYIAAKSVGMLQTKSCPKCGEHVKAMPCPKTEPCSEPCQPPAIEVIDLSSFQGLQSAEPMKTPEACGEFETVVVPPGSIEETEPTSLPPMPPAEGEDTPAQGGLTADLLRDLFHGDDADAWPEPELLPMPHEEDQVGQSLEMLKNILAKALPTASITPVPGAGNTVILTGTVAHSEDIDTCVRIVRTFTAGSSGCDIVNALKVGVEEIEHLPMPHEVHEGTVEESDTMPQGTPPDCQEDPKKSECYPECPMSGSCPARGCPMTPPVKIEQPEAGDPDTMEARPSDVDAKPESDVPYTDVDVKPESDVPYSLESLTPEERQVIQDILTPQAEVKPEKNGDK
jgi:hypothetical protein